MSKTGDNIAYSTGRTPSTPRRNKAQNGTREQSNAAARKALELDATLAHPHAVLGNNEMEYEWDFAGGEAEYKKAFELDPDDATAHQWYSTDIAMIEAESRKPLRRPIVPTNSTRCLRSSAITSEAFTS